MTRGSKKRSKLTLAKCISFSNIHTVEFCKKNTGSSIFWYSCKKYLSLRIWMLQTINKSCRDENNQLKSFITNSYGFII